MSKTYILFVDDDPNILEGLRNRLRRHRDRWAMTFAPGGEEALAHLRTAHVDVLVTDMRMPRMDGAELLGHVKREFPDVVRIVLSGHSELERTRRSIPAAHQFIAKPCEDQALERVIERALALRELVGDERVRRVVGRIETLPAIPATYAEVRRLLGDPDSGAQEIAAVIRQDPAVCARVLQMVNSAFFGLPRTIARVEDAVVYLGLERAANVVLASELFRVAPTHTRLGFSVSELQRHALATAQATVRLLPAGPDREDAYTAALLHDVGELVLAAYLPAELEEILREAARAHEPTHVVEARLHGVTHAEIGGYLLGLWGLPHPVVEIVANHHAPARVGEATFGALGAVHVADALDRLTRAGTLERPDMSWLASVGVDEPTWEAWLEDHRAMVERAEAAPSRRGTP